MTSDDGRAWMPVLPAEDELRSWNLDPAWSRTLDVQNPDGSLHRWHVLDTGHVIGAAGETPVATMVCVHGNPTWAYSWATFLRRFGHRCRVIALDQLGMGFSERTSLRRYEQRVGDLGALIDALGIDQELPLFLAAHDWGGAIAMGWAVDNPDRVAGMVLCNTGIAVPAGRRSPALIRLAASAPLRDLVCRRTPIFVAGTARLSRSRIGSTDRAAFAAPYRTARHRAAVADFVGDVPLRPGGGHPSEAALANVADRLHRLTAPVLLAWGAADPVFNDDFAADLAERLPNTSLQRFPKASHLVMAEADVAGAVDRWLDDVLGGKLDEVPDETVVDSQPSDPVIEGAQAPDGDRRSLWSEIDQRRDSEAVAFADMATGAEITWLELAERVDRVAAELAARGLEPGDSVAMLTPPGVDLAAAIYGVWRSGGVTVVADRGLGLGGLRGAVRSARPRWVIGPKAALAVARTLRWAPGAELIDIDELVATNQYPESTLPAEPDARALAAILFTSGATGPAKGVRYRHEQLEAQRDALAATYRITSDDRLMAAFAPFALYGPALGIPTALPDCDVTSPGKLTCTAFAEACERVAATLAFASPAALSNVVATSEQPERADGEGSATINSLRLVMSAGAPVPAETLTAVGQIAPGAELHTPYGMTEVLPVADIDLASIEAATEDEPSGGVCVGHPVEGADVIILPLDFDPTDPPAPCDTGVMGEIVVNAPWVSDGYLGLRDVERMARPVLSDGKRWHRSGDVGHLDRQGRLWVEGRAVHIVHAIGGPITSVPVERSVERALELQRVAAVGVGPTGLEQLVIVLEDGRGIDGLASTDLTARVRKVVADALTYPVAAVLTLRSMPVDIRHNAKIDRGSVAAWATELLAGRTPTAPDATGLRGRLVDLARRGSK